MKNEWMYMLVPGRKPRIAHNANLIFPNMVRPDVALGVCLVQWS